MPDDDERIDAARIEERERVRAAIVRQIEQADRRSDLRTHIDTRAVLGDRREGRLVAALVGLLLEWECE